MNDAPWGPEPSNDTFTVTLKEHGGYDAAWLVVRGGTAAEVADALEAADAAGLGAIVGRVSQSFSAQAAAGRGLGATPNDHPSSGQQNGSYGRQSGYQNQGGQQNQGQQNQARMGPQAPPPGMVPPNCPHGTKQYVVGKYGPFWGCPGNQNDPSRCRPEKIRP